MEIVPPGDVRPAFKHDISLLQKACDDTFEEGSGKHLFPDDGLILLNKIGSLDDDYQTFINGEWIGNLRFNIKKKDFAFIPTMIGAKYIYKFYKDKGFFEKGRFPRKMIKYSIEAEEYIIEGKSILVPGIENGDFEVDASDPCIVFTDNGVVACGYYVKDGTELKRMMASGKGCIAKNRHHESPISNENVKFPFEIQQKTWNDAIKINSGLIDGLVHKAITFINNVRRKYSLPVAVAYSGGKDSLATLLLLKKSFDEYNPRDEAFFMFFSDTGLEFPEVIENIDAIKEWLKIDDKHFYIRSAGEKFWELIQNFGPPARDFRFCCHALKANQINKIIENITLDVGNEDNRLLVFLGQRRYESFSRAKEKRIYTNSYIPFQIAATPIKEWNALEEWLFLLREKHENEDLPINPLYFKGHDRIGCYLCPAQSLASLELLKETHPALHQRWMSFLDKYRKKMGYPLEWIDLGLWRFKELKGQWKGYSLKLNKSLKELEKAEIKSPRDLKIIITKGISPCKNGGFSVKGRFSRPILLDSLFPYIKILNKHFELDVASGVVFLNRDKIRFMFYADGSFFLQSPDEGFKFMHFLKSLLGIVARSLFCQKCGVCVDICPSKILKIDKRSNKLIITDINRCRGATCQKCTFLCPIYDLIQDNVINADDTVYTR
ncbi:MAG: phosphoadenosine phosphosulfate reductase domain-containing protein [Promethearchaeota archaeon]